MSTKPAAGRPDGAAPRRGRKAVQITFTALAVAYLMYTMVQRPSATPVELERDAIVYVNQAPPMPAPGATITAQPSPIQATITVQPSPVPETVQTQAEVIPAVNYGFSLEAATSFEIPADAPPS